MGGYSLRLLLFTAGPGGVVAEIQQVATIPDLHARLSTFPRKSELLSVRLYGVDADVHCFDVGCGWKGTHLHIGQTKRRWSSSSSTSTGRWDCSLCSLCSLLDCSRGVADVLFKGCQGSVDCLSVVGAISHSGGKQLSGETGGSCVFGTSVSTCLFSLPLELV